MRSLGVRRSGSVVRRWVTVLTAAGAVAGGLDAAKPAVALVTGWLGG